MLPHPAGLIFWLAILYTICTAQPTSSTNNTHNLVCEPVPLCEPCPEEALHQPFCQPFGNRRLMHCRNITSSVASDSSPSAESDTDTTTDAAKPNTRPHYKQRPPEFSLSSDVEEGIILAWESCGRVVSTERADFFEFVAVNLLFACVSVGIVIWRSKRMRLLHARQLAARIGMAGRRR